VNITDLDAAHAAAIRKHWRELTDNDGVAPLALLVDLADIADEHARQRILADAEEPAMVPAGPSAVIEAK
jgi:hypothetical protein